MNKLNNILREGGFPVTGEALQVLHDYQRYIHAIMSSFEIEPGTVVFLELNQTLNLPNFVLADSYIYVVPETFDLNKTGHIYKLKGDSTIIISDLLANTHAKKGLQIIETPSTVSFNGVDYVNYMSIIEAQLIDATPAYTFKRLTDLIELANYSNISLSNISLPADYSFNDKHRNVFKYNLNRVEMQLSLNYTGPGTGMMTMLEIPITASVAVQLQIAVGAMYPISMCIYNATNIINVPCVLYRENISTFKIIADTINVTINSNSVVELKGNIVL